MQQCAKRVIEKISWIFHGMWSGEQGGARGRKGPHSQVMILFKVT